MCHSFFRVSLEQVARNLLAQNSMETYARKTISKSTTTLVILVQLTQEFTLHAWKHISSVFHLQFSLFTLHPTPDFVLHGCTISKLSFFLSPFFPCTKLNVSNRFPNPYKFPLLWISFLDSHSSQS
jgi:hypothetical protein